MADRRAPDRGYGSPRMPERRGGRPRDDVRGRGQAPRKPAKGSSRNPAKGRPKGRSRDRLPSTYATQQEPSDAVVTLPNLLTVLRLVGVPVFLVAAVVQHDHALALGVLVLGGITDLLDGWLARRLNQRSRLGEVLDPIADRVYVLAVVLGMAAAGVIPWWLAVLLPLRDVLLLGLVPSLRSRGLSRLPVHFVGKAATFNLLIAFPLLFFANTVGHPVAAGLERSHTEVVCEVARALGWAFAGWGAGLYWWAGFLYLGQVRRLLATTPPLPKSQVKPARPAKPAKPAKAPKGGPRRG